MASEHHWQFQEIVKASAIQPWLHAASRVFKCNNQTVISWLIIKNQVGRIDEIITIPKTKKQTNNRKVDSNGAPQHQTHSTS